MLKISITLNTLPVNTLSGRPGWFAKAHRPPVWPWAILGNARRQRRELWHSRQRTVCKLQIPRGAVGFDSHPRLHLESAPYEMPWAPRPNVQQRTWGGNWYPHKQATTMKVGVVGFRRRRRGRSGSTRPALRKKMARPRLSAIQECPAPGCRQYEQKARPKRHPGLVGRPGRGTDVRTNDVAGDNEFNPPVLLPAAGGVIRGHRQSFSEAS
jgi:hypothetical protein